MIDAAIRDWVTTVAVLHALSFWISLLAGSCQAAWLRYYHAKDKLAANVHKKDMLG